MAKEAPRKSTGKKRSAKASREPASTASQRQPLSFFMPDTLEKTVIAVPLLERLQKDGLTGLQDIIVDVNRDYPGGREQAQQQIRTLIADLVKAHRVRNQGVHARKTGMTRRYVFGRLRGDLIQELVRRDRERARDGALPALHRVWPDFEVRTLTDRTIATVKADAARNAFGADGRDILWAVVDSGIDASHPHFQKFGNLKLDPPLRHCDFTTFGEVDEETSEKAALTDERGHGTHVAGIIAGALQAGDGVTIGATINRKDEEGRVVVEQRPIEAISGMAPACKLISFKVLDKHGGGPVSNLIVACERIQEINGNGRYMRIHGVNMSVGYAFEPSWFACGQSPLCVEVDRLVRSGVVVVVAAGNDGYGWNQSAFRGAAPGAMGTTITDPGNAELAITVGSTHRENPLRNGVSYFSSKGPTSDGRMKPDLVAPGENITSCASSGVGNIAISSVTSGNYKVDTGTSMAAPHVSGLIAAFLSICREFIGRPEETKEIFMANATDLGRAQIFQGRGMVDLFRVLSYVRGVPEKTASEYHTPLPETVKYGSSFGETAKSTDNNHAPIKLFISYSHKDERLRLQLETHLSLLRRHGIVDEWHDRRIGAGQEWVGEIDKHLDAAKIILLLISAEFLASDYCYDREMMRALARHETGEAVVIPVILRHVDWAGAPFARLQALPQDGRPVTSWPTRDKGFDNIARGVRKVAEQLRSLQS